MGLFKPDFYRSLLAGFAIGTLATALSIGTPLALLHKLAL